MQEAEILKDLMLPENREILNKILIEELKDVQARLDNAIEILEGIAQRAL